MSKKQILVIMTGAIELGGVERSLIGLLNGFDYETYDVDLFLYGHHGPLMKMIDKRVNILPEVKELAHLRESLGAKLKNGCFVSAYYRLRDELMKRVGKFRGNDASWAQVMRKCAKPQPKQYDMALSFFLPFDYLSEMVNARIKLGWIHTDYSTEPTDPGFLLEQYSKADRIVAISEKSGEAFCGCVPELKDRVMVVENLLPAAMVKAEADAFDATPEMPATGIRLLSIGRYCTAKNFDSIPDICSHLRSAGLDVTWYIIGFGSDEALIREKIAQAKMEDHVILLGKKDNPYPYIKTCDLYVQPSRYEGKCVAVREAQMLGKPVVITRYPTAASQLEDGVDGMIVPLDHAGCAEGIAKLLRDTEKMRILAENCRGRDYSNRDELQKIYELI